MPSSNSSTIFLSMTSNRSQHFISFWYHHHYEHIVELDSDWLCSCRFGGTALRSWRNERRRNRSGDVKVTASFPRFDCCCCCGVVLSLLLVVSSCKTRRTGLKRAKWTIASSRTSTDPPRNSAKLWTNISSRLLPNTSKHVSSRSYDAFDDHPHRFLFIHYYYFAECRKIALLGSTSQHWGAADSRNEYEGFHWG